jgi:hypothetical protein
MVIDINGISQNRKDCKLISGKYYLINKDVFFVEDKWYRLSSGLIEFDNEKKEYQLKKKLIFGVIDIKDNTLITGYFSQNIYNNVKLLVHGNQIDCIDYKILQLNGYQEIVDTDLWGNKNALLFEIKRYTDFPYNIEDDSLEFEIQKSNFNNNNIELSKGVRIYANMLKDLTYGVEIETSFGYVPKYIRNRYGLCICRDGSVKGAEYVTIPLTKAKGLQSLTHSIEEINKRCKTDIDCSLHIHLGNVNVDRLSIVSVYILFTKIQNELYKCFPYYKTNSKGIKTKTYSKKLPILFYGLNSKDKEVYESFITDCYSKIFAYFGENGYPNKHNNRKMKKHPISRKWNILSRHVGLNFCNVLFSKRNTYEFRIHENTTNSQKVINWLFITNAIIRYAIANSKELIYSSEKISLSDVLNYYKNEYKNQYGSFLSEYLIEYMKVRKDYFEKDALLMDFRSDKWSNDDKNFQFSYKGVTNLF